jgi:Fumble
MSSEQKFRIAVNVDIDKIKVLTKYSVPSELKQSPRIVLYQQPVSEIGGVQYFSWVIYFADLYSDEECKKEITACFGCFSSDEYQILLSGNGIDSHKTLLEQLFGSELFNSLARKSQVYGIREGLFTLQNSGPQHFYSIKPQNLLDMKSMVYSEDMEFPGRVIFPLIVISIKGGVNFYKLESPDAQPKKLLASIMGELTIAGFVRLCLTDPNTPSNGVWSRVNTLIDESWRSGSNLKVDLTVGDIYGPGVEKIAGLHKDIIASSMGKSASQLKDTSDLDYIVSAIVMLAINIGNMGSLLVVSSDQLRLDQKTPNQWWFAVTC